MPRLLLRPEADQQPASGEEGEPMNMDDDRLEMWCPFDENDKPKWMVGLTDPAKAKEMWKVLMAAWTAAIRVCLGDRRPPAKGGE